MRSFVHSNAHLNWPVHSLLLIFLGAVPLRHDGEFGFWFYFWVVSVLCGFKFISRRISLGTSERLESLNIPGRRAGIWAHRHGCHTCRGRSSTSTQHQRLCPPIPLLGTQTDCSEQAASGGMSRKEILYSQPSKTPMDPSLSSLTGWQIYWLGCSKPLNPTPFIPC